MLRIVANNISLELEDDIEIELIIESPLMLVDRVPVPYTLTFGLKPTPNNLRALEYPNRVTSIRLHPEVASKIYHSDLNFLTGVLTVVNYDEMINVSFRGISLLDNLKKKLFDIEMERNEFGTATLSGMANPSSSINRKWEVDYREPTNFGGMYKALADDAAAGLKDNWTLGPVRINGENFDYGQNSHGAPLNQFDRNADNMYFNFFNAANDNFILFARDGDFPISGKTMAHSSAFPQIYLHYIFNKLFSDVLTSNPFASGELSDLVLLTSFHPEYYRKVTTVTSQEFRGMLFDNPKGHNEAFDPYFYLNSFLGDIDANTFLKNIMKTFCFSIYPENGQFRIVSNQEICTNPESEKWTDKLIGELTIEKVEGLLYKYGYEGIEQQTIEAPEDFHLSTIQDVLEQEMPGDDPNIICFVETTGEYYEKNVVDDSVTYKRLDSGLGGNKDLESNDVFDSTTLVQPLPMCLTGYWTDIQTSSTQVPNWKTWYVPEWTGDRMQRNTQAYIMFARGMVETFTSGEEYPLLTATNYDHLGNRLGDLSLAWDGPDGLIERFHKDFKIFIEKEKVKITGEFLLTAADIRNLNLPKKKHILGRNFLIEKVHVKLKKYEILPSLVELTEA